MARATNEPPSSAFSKRGGGGGGILVVLSRSHVAAHGREAATMTKKLLRSTRKAVWIAGTTFLMLVVPLSIEMDREQQLNGLELQQQMLLGRPPPAAAAKQIRSSMDRCSSPDEELVPVAPVRRETTFV